MHAIIDFAIIAIVVPKIFADLLAKNKRYSLTILYLITKYKMYCTQSVPEVETAAKTTQIQFATAQENNPKINGLRRPYLKKIDNIYIASSQLVYRCHVI